MHKVMDIVEEDQRVKLAIIMGISVYRNGKYLHNSLDMYKMSVQNWFYTI